MVHWHSSKLIETACIRVGLEGGGGEGRSDKLKDI